MEGTLLVKKYYIFFSILITICCSFEASSTCFKSKSPTDFPTFTKEEIDLLPSIKRCTELVVGDIFSPDGFQMKGRTWHVHKHIGLLNDIDHEKLKAATAGGLSEFTVQPVMDKRFVCPLFEIDADGNFKMVVVISLKSSNNSKDTLIPHSYFINIVTQLTKEELENPFIKNIKGDFKFKDLEKTPLESELERLDCYALSIHLRCMPEDKDKTKYLDFLNR